jgi:hypothetical protein
MILVDLNQVMISNLMAQIGGQKDFVIDEDLFRHMALNSLRGYKKKFGNEYGDLVICCDDKNFWRKQLFPPYKAHRKKARDKSDYDWPNIFNCLNRVRAEIKEFFPYKFIHIEHAEADDIIGTLCEHITMEPVLILSGDKDFIQCQVYPLVDQYDPIRKMFIKHEDPVRYLKEHIMKGDRGDGIPNFISEGECFINGGRQRPLRKTFIDKVVYQGQDALDDKQKAGWERNEKLVDLRWVPAYIKNEAIEQYQESGQGRDKMFGYFVHYKLTTLMENISEF